MLFTLSIITCPFFAEILVVAWLQTVVETAAEEELRVAKEWLDDGRRGRVLLRRRENCVSN